MTSMLGFARRVAGSLSLLTALAFVSGCAGSMPERLREARTGAYVFHHPAAEVEAAARALLEADGFNVIASYSGGLVRTEWRSIMDDEQFASAFERYIIVVQRLTSEHCRVAAMKISVSTLGMETAHPHTTSKNEGVGRNENTKTYGKGTSPLPLGTPAVRRDLDLEWKLITREEPERARLVQSDIDWMVAHR